MARLIDQEKPGVLRVAPRLLYILRVLVHHKFLGALLGKRHWTPYGDLR